MRVKTAIITTTAIALMVLTDPSSATAAPVQSRQYFEVIFRGTADNPVATVVASGAITARGSAIEESFQDNPDGSLRTVERFDFPAGSVTVTAVGNSTEHLYPQACLDISSAKGTYQMSGAGGFAGITGHGTFVESGFFRASQTPTGCAPPLTLHAIVRYVGVVDR